MKKTTRLILVLSMVLCMLLALPFGASATGTQTQDGLEVTITTDAKEYTANEDIQISVTVTNTNAYKVEGLSLETLLPQGFELKSGEISAQDLALEPGASYTASVVVELPAATEPTQAATEPTQSPTEPTQNPTKPSENPTEPTQATKPVTPGSTATPGTDDASMMVVWAVLALSSTAGIVLTVKYRKTMQALSLVLCAAMLLSVLPAEALAVENTASVTVDQTIAVDGKSYTITATVTYPVAAEGSQTVPAEIAALYGISPYAEDTDKDGLGDYLEIYTTGTHPAMADTDGNGISDADEDGDADGLTNAQELELGTNLTQPDSDTDGLSDFEEVNTTHTDPCLADTDGDLLSDGDELVLGLDPLAQKTDGNTLDCERTFTQELNPENIDLPLSAEDNAARPGLTLTATGNINRRVSLCAATLENFTDSRAVVGKPLVLNGSDLGQGTMTFTLAEAPEISEGYSTLVICHYSEDGSTEYLETAFDAQTNQISATVSQSGTYFVLNVKNLFNELGLELPSQAQNRARSAGSNAKASTRNSAMAQADIIFLIDTTGSMTDEIDHVKENVDAFVNALKAKGVSAGLALIDYQDLEEDGYDSTKVHKNGTSNWFYDMDAYKAAISALDLGYGGDDPECVVDALETGRLLDLRASAGKFFILVTDADYKVDNRYGIPSMAAEIELLKNAGVTCAVVSPEELQNSYYELYYGTKGAWVDLYGNFHTELMSLADTIGNQVVGDGYWIYLEGPVPVPVRLDAKPQAGSTADTDKDGIYDIHELEGVDPTGSIDLDALITDISQGVITGTNYGTVMMYKYKSSPVEVDSDYDGIADSKDSAPKSNAFSGVLHYDNDKSKCNVEFNVNYSLMFQDNTMYYKDLSVMSMIYAADIYSDLYVEVTGGAKGGSNNASDLAKLFGLEDVEDIHIAAKEYAVDKDDQAEFVVGHRTVQYGGKTKDIILLVVRGTASYAEWSSNFDLGAETPEYYKALGSEHPHWRNKANHKGFDVATNRILDKYYDYVQRHGLEGTGNEKSILITGHSRGAAIANLLGAHFEDSADYTSYVYTFATPYSTTDPNAASYQTIFNVTNADDLIAYMPLEAWGFKKYGKIMSVSVASLYKDNQLFGDKAGTFEALIGATYNDNGGIADALTAFAALAKTREDLYVLDTSDNGIVNIGNQYHVTQSGAEKRLEALRTELEAVKLTRFCQLAIYETTGIKRVNVRYTPAYLLQNLANMAAGMGPTTGYDVKGPYATAKTKFIVCFIDGMTHPHMQPTYYLIARNNFEPLP